MLHFRPYLYGRRFRIVTDHQPLHWLLTNSKLSGKLARWALLLSEYDMDITHRAGRVHCNADCLSEPETTDDTGARHDEGQHLLPPSACLAYWAVPNNEDTDAREDEEAKHLKIWLNPSKLQQVQDRANRATAETKDGYYWQDGILWRCSKGLHDRCHHHQVSSSHHADP